MPIKRNRLLSHIRRITYAFEELDDASNLKSDLVIIQDILNCFIHGLAEDTEKPGHPPADVRHPCERSPDGCIDPIPGAFKNHALDSPVASSDRSISATYTGLGVVAAHARGKGDDVNYADPISTASKNHALDSLVAGSDRNISATCTGLGVISDHARGGGDDVTTHFDGSLAVDVENSGRPGGSSSTPSNLIQLACYTTVSTPKSSINTTIMTCKTRRH